MVTFVTREQAATKIPANMVHAAMTHVIHRSTIALVNTAMLVLTVTLKMSVLPKIRVKDQVFVRWTANLRQSVSVLLASRMTVQAVAKVFGIFYRL